MIKQYVLLIIILTASITTYAQNRVLEITGKVISEHTQKPVPYATVINIEKNTATLSDSLGFFHITMLEKENLRISALGYTTQTLNFQGVNLSEINVYIVALSPRIYELSAIDIYAARWKDFEFEFKNMEIEENQTQKRIQEWFYTLISPKELALITSSTAIGIPIHFKTSQEKQRIKLKEIKAKEHKSDVIHTKYNSNIVSEITGLQGQDLEDFMQWSRFNTEFLYYANDYDILNAVRVRFEQYQKQNR